MLESEVEAAEVMLPEKRGDFVLLPDKQDFEPVSAFPQGIYSALDNAGWCIVATHSIHDNGQHGGAVLFTY
jgi:hypothetical protein